MISHADEHVFLYFLDFHEGIYSGGMTSLRDTSCSFVGNSHHPKIRNRITKNYMDLIQAWVVATKENITAKLSLSQLRVRYLPKMVDCGFILTGLCALLQENKYGRVSLDLWYGPIALIVIRFIFLKRSSGCTKYA